jgi:hypothetical protein
MGYIEQETTRFAREYFAPARKSKLQAEIERRARLRRALEYHRKRAYKLALRELAQGQPGPGLARYLALGGTTDDFKPPPPLPPAPVVARNWLGFQI